MEETFDAEDYTVGAAEGDGDAGSVSISITESDATRFGKMRRKSA